MVRRGCLLDRYQKCEQPVTTLQSEPKLAWPQESPRLFASDGFLFGWVDVTHSRFGEIRVQCEFDLMGGT